MSFTDLASDIDNDVLKDIILERVRRAGRIPFSEYMRLVLYHPVQGYYFACDPARDFQSSPQVHPVFGAAIGRHLAGLWRQMGQPARFDAFEAGAGDGRLAADLLRWSRRAEPDFFEAVVYTLQDPRLRSAEGAGLMERLGLPPGKVFVADALPDHEVIEGCILSNELLDALPFERVRVSDGRLLEVHVGAEGTRLLDAPAPAGEAVRRYFQEAGLAPGEGCAAEANLEAPAWMESAARALRRGYVLTLDYGYEAGSLYAAWRRQGTMLTFYRHTSGDDPYARVGRQDITASIDLTAVRRAGERAGMTTIGTATQAQFLSSLGIGEALTKPDPARLQEHFALRRAIVELTDPSGLGRIHALLQGKGVPDAPQEGFMGSVGAAAP